MALDEFRNKFGKVFTEFLGTMFLVLIIQLAVLSGSSLAPLAIGLGLVAIVYAMAPISGAHVNPAVTLAIFLRGKIPVHEGLMYWVAQILGGLAGALVGAIIGGGAIAPGPGKGTHFIQTFLAEGVFTAILCYIVLGVATSSAAENNSWYGLAIGTTILGGAVCVGPISGASFNPAVTIGLCIIKNNWKIWKNGYALWTMIAQMGGAVLGAFAYYLSAPAEFEHFGENFNVGELQAEVQSLLPGN